MTAPRVAFFTDSFHEVNGVAHTSRQLVRFAHSRSFPLFSVHAGPADAVSMEGSIQTFEFRRGRVRLQLERDLAMDLLFLRYRTTLRNMLREFRPDVVHITGPGDAGILGAFCAHELGVPLVASWHTNLHEYAARRLASIAAKFGKSLHNRITGAVENVSLAQCLRFYRLAKIVLAPNPELVELLASGTGRPARLMKRGVDTELFSPAPKDRSGRPFVIGYVGRLSPEKNLRLLPDVERSLRAAGILDYRFLIVGDGSDKGWLQSALSQAEFPGILRSEDLARAYSSMDAFVFPSQTDTYGNVVLEAMASGVPPVVFTGGGAKFLVNNGSSGYIVPDSQGMALALQKLYQDESWRLHMASQARIAAEGCSWAGVFEKVYSAYDACLQLSEEQRERPRIHELAADGVAGHTGRGPIRR